MGKYIMKYKAIKNDQLILTLELKNNEKIEIYADDHFDLITHYSYTTVIFYQGNKLYILENDLFIPLHHFLIRLQKLLCESLSHNLKLDDSITYDIGYLWNIWIHGNDISLARVIKNNKYPFWVGEKYELSSGQYVSWIYNDEQNNIIFQMTPTYPVVCFDQENQREVKKYQAWMKKYRSRFKTIIPIDIAILWIEETQQILDIIHVNSEKLYSQRKF